MKKTALQIIFYLIAAAVLGYTLYIPYHFFSPFVIGHDEAKGIIQSTINFLESETISDKLSHLFHTKGQHVTFGMQLSSLSLYYTLGHINLQAYNYIGLGALLIATTLIVINNKNHFCNNKTGKDPLILSSIIVISITLSLSPSHNSCIINTACTGNHYLGLAFSIISLYFLCQPPRYSSLLASNSFLMLALFSSPAGLALIPIIALRLFLQKDDRALLIKSALISVLITALYLYMVSDTSLHKPRLDQLGGFWIAALRFISFFLTMIASVFYWPEGQAAYLIMTIIGLSILIAYILLVKYTLRQQDHHFSFSFLGSLTLLGMMLLITIGRFHYGFGSPRYAVYASIFVLFTLLHISHLIDEARIRRWLTIAAFSCSALFIWNHSQNWPYLKSLEHTIHTCNTSWYEKQRACGVMIKHQKATELLLEAESKGVLRLPR